jgi:prepilin-type N-terminal cleavage/methylation domain-containing protein
MRRRIRSRCGFSLLELLIALTVIGTVMAMASPAVGRSLAESRLQRAATVAAADLQYAYSLASRQRAPVRISIDVTNRIIRVRDHQVATRIYTERRYDSTAEFAVQYMRVSPQDTARIIYPNGMVSGGITMILGSGDRTRTVRMTQAGQVRVSQ